MSNKVKKILNIVVDVVVAVVLVLVLFLAICAIRSKAKGYDGYTEIFGKAYVAVSSNSMSGDKEDNFSKGDMIVIKTLSSDDLSELEVGDIITFKTIYITDDDNYVLNTHRIVAINQQANGSYTFTTKGDNNSTIDSDPVSGANVVGVYQSKASGIGYVLLFMRSSTGFFVCVVLPSLLIAVYFAINLVLVILKERKVQNAANLEAKQKEHDLLMEQARAEVLAELAAKEKEEKK
jgi:signal peptidase